MFVHDRLDGNGFVELIRAGHRRLKDHVTVINSLNIFPVPDGDTGTNMEMSLSSGVAKLAQQTNWTLPAAVQSLASGLLMGARGNSGVILSQLFRGFIKVCQNADALETSLFAHALHEGVQIAYRAVAKPVEGTILTVAREAAHFGMQEAKTNSSLSDWMLSVYHAAQAALDKTPEQLPVLKQANVVDSGGQGLVYIYEGFSRYLRGEVDDVAEPVAKASRQAAEVDFAAAHVHHEGEHGYCTEVLIRIVDGKEEFAEKQLREGLSAYGDSLLVVGAEDLVKVHVHTLQPGRVLQDALQFGPLVHVKIENMTEQHDVILQKSSPSAHAQPHSVAKQHKATAVIAVAAGTGLSEIFHSLGVDIVVEGGQTMNPSTEEIVAAIESAECDTAIILPNNKNIIMAAEQAKEVLGDRVRIVGTTTIPQGIAAMMGYQANASADQNVLRMREAIEGVLSGQVVRAVRDSVYQGHDIKKDQYLGFVNQDLLEVGDSRQDVALRVIREMGAANAELLTVFYGADVPEEEIQSLQSGVGREFGVEVEAKFGGQPIYEYIFTLE